MVSMRGKSLDHEKFVKAEHTVFGSVHKLPQSECNKTVSGF